MWVTKLLELYAYFNPLKPTVFTDKSTKGQNYAITIYRINAFNSQTLPTVHV
jgi:hypothetical protein